MPSQSAFLYRKMYVLVLEYGKAGYQFLQKQFRDQIFQYWEEFRFSGG